jgi:hypothetical protein
VKWGRRVGYRHSALERFLEASTRTSTAAA